MWPLLFLKVGRKWPFAHFWPKILKNFVGDFLKKCKKVAIWPKKVAIWPFSKMDLATKNASTTRVLGFFGHFPTFFYNYTIKNLFYINKKSLKKWAFGQNVILDKKSGEISMHKVERIGSMIPGTRCPFIVDGETKYYSVKEDSKGVFAITFNGKRLREQEVPFGVEVKI